VVNWQLGPDGIHFVLGKFWQFTFEMEYCKDKTLSSFPYSLNS
jgi:hypothetical protein